MSRTPITIRTAALKDLPALVALSQASSQAAHWSSVQWNDIFHTEIPARHAWISQSPEGPCGFLVAASGVAAAGEPAEWELENMAVAEACRRQGVGRMLLRQLLMAATESHAGRILLEVRESNLAARALYTASGFQLLARRTGYYEAPAEDALILVHTLDHAL